MEQSFDNAKITTIVFDMINGYLLSRHEQSIDLSTFMD